MPISRAFEPDLVIVSAGFDAAVGDPLGECLLTPGLYGHLTKVRLVWVAAGRARTPREGERRV